MVSLFSKEAVDSVPAKQSPAGGVPAHQLPANGDPAQQNNMASSVQVCGNRRCPWSTELQILSHYYSKAK